MNDKTQTICCDECGHEFARIDVIKGRRSVTVHSPGLEVQVISKSPDIYGAICPECEHTTILDSELINNL